MSYTPPSGYGNLARRDENSVAAVVCAVGFFLRLLLSGPLLNVFGIDYGSDDAGTLSKIHPGSYLILLSFVILLFSHRDPVGQLIKIARDYPAYVTFFVIYLVAFFYWIVRGPKGVGVLLDIHMGLPICAIVFSYAPLSYCKRILHFFLFFAVMNSCVALFEAATHLRIFPFDPDWEVLLQDYFRASAFLGHPLTNAAFTVVAIFVLLAAQVRPVLKTLSFVIMLASLIAFGGRSALGFGVAGLALYGLVAGGRRLFSQELTVRRILLAAVSLIMLPAFCILLLSATLKSGIGERLMAYNSFEDDSASVRLLSMQVFDYMNVSDVFLGMDGEQIAAIGSHTGVAAPTSDIENPWILMLMFFGIILFTFWFFGLLAVITSALRDTPFALKMAVFEYFLIASTANSFGRKDPIYVVAIAIVICAKRVLWSAKSPSSIEPSPVIITNLS